MHPLRGTAVPPRIWGDAPFGPGGARYVDEDAAEDERLPRPLRVAMGAVWSLVGVPPPPPKEAHQVPTKGKESHATKVRAQTQEGTQEGEIKKPKIA